MASLAIRVSKPMKRCPQVQYIIASVKERKAEKMDTNFPSTETHANQGAEQGLLFLTPPEGEPPAKDR